MRRRPILITVAAALLASCADQPVPTEPGHLRPSLANLNAISITPTTLGGLSGSTYDIAYGVNDAGTVVGVSGGQFGNTAVLWATGTGVVPATTTPTIIDVGDAHDINNAGQIAGEYGAQAVLWTPNGAGGYTRTEIRTQLASPIISTAWAINAVGQVVGGARIPDGLGGFTDECFLWTPTAPNATSGNITMIDDLGGGWCVANDINSAGYVTGASLTGPPSITHAFVWVPTTGITVDILSGTDFSYGSAINDAGTVAGHHLTPTGPEVAAVFSQTGPSSWSVQDLGLFTKALSHAIDINNAGHVVGFEDDNLGNSSAFFWQNGTFSALAGLANQTTSATAISNATSTGQMVAIGGSLEPVAGKRTAIRWAVRVARGGPKP